MGKCPFCSVEIDEELVLYGGTCPTCLIEIPGEEAPTDPGLNASEAEPNTAQVHAQQSSPSGGRLMAVSAVLLIVIGGGLAWGLGGSEKTESSVDDYEAQVSGDHQNLDRPDVEEEVAQSETLGSGPTGAVDPDAGSEANANRETRTQTRSQHRESTTVSSQAQASSGETKNDWERSIDASSGVVNVRRSSSSQDFGSDSGGDVTSIINMKHSQLKKRLQACMPLDTTGNIALSYTIQTDGSITSINIRPSDSLDDPSLKSCFLNTAKKNLKFNEVGESQPVRITFNY